MKYPTERVGNLAEQIRGVSYGKEDASDTRLPGYVPVLRAGNITDDGLVFDDLVFVPAERVSEKQKIQRFDVVIAASSGSLDVVGKAAPALENYDGGFGAFCKVLRPNSKIHPNFFAHFFKTLDYRRRVSALAAGANINNLRNEHLDEMTIPIPPPPEQRRIADVLDRAEALRAKRCAASAQLDTLTQAIFLEMFGDPATNRNNYRIVRFADICERIFKGAFDLKASCYLAEGIPFIRIADIQVNTIDLTNAVYIDERTHLRYRDSELRNDDIVFSKVGTIDRIALIPTSIPQCNISQNNVGAILHKSMVHPRYALTLLTTPYALGRIRAGSKKAVQDKLVLEELRKLPFMLPPIDLQCEFGHRIWAVEQLKSSHDISLIKLDNLFASIQHRAFRGSCDVPHFTFLQTEWPAVYEAAARAEASAIPDPRTACFYARRALELLVSWVYKSDASLRLPYQDNLSALIHEPTFKAAAGDAVFNKARVITRLGNTAVHSPKAVLAYDAQTAVKELFHVGYWLAHTYAKGPKPAPGLVFDSAALPKTTALPKQTIDQLQKLETQLRDRDEKLSTLLADKESLDAELARLRSEIAEAKKANTARPDDHDYSEAETRDYFIDLLLKEAGWPLDQPRDREYEVAGMPNKQEKRFVDYVLWGDDGLPLGLVEAKRTKRDARVGQQQAKLYADCLEAKFGRRPVIFYSNGYEHWLWDDTNYPPRAVQGFYKKAELELMIQRRTSRKPLAPTEINGAIVERFYQTRAIRRIGEAFETDKDRKALLVMATGSGKTRTVIALADLLMRCNWVKRVLFLADRVALVNQAINAFKKFLPEASPVNLVTEKEAEGRVFASTYPTMMGLIDDTKDGYRRFGVGHFDLVVIDEAHRSVFQKYKAIFEYFDSLLVGLTATPKDEIDRNTYTLFDLENRVPTDAYSLDDAVKDKFLVPAKSVSVPLKFPREGITYNELSEEEKEEWDALEWDEAGEVPDRVEAAAVNKWLFNTDTVDKVLAHLMTRGQTVAGGDRLGKTIIFAKNEAHARFVSDRFNVNYPHYKGHFAQVITFKTEYAQSLIDKFMIKEQPPHIAISVDMLDTGIDVPEVVNLVFFKMVRSKTKFWQMVGRGTRLCPDLFGPGQHKQFFYLFDYCGNLEFFSVNPDATDGVAGESLGKRLFKARLELVGELDHRGEKGITPDQAKQTEAELRTETAEALRLEVAAMNLDNFVVRPKRKYVEKYAKPEAWTHITEEAHGELSHEVADLPAELESEAEEAKRFDLLMLRLQLAVLRAEHTFERLRDQVKEIAGLLEEKATIPMVREQLPLIQDLQSDEWWMDVTTPMLENVRKKLRGLVKFIEKSSRAIVYTNFEDELGAEARVELPGFAGGGDFEQFRSKARSFLREQQNHPTVRKLRSNQQLTTTDLSELEKMLATSGVGKPEEIERAKTESHGLGVFVRSLVGLDREAAKHALSGFLTGKTLNSKQIEFVDMVINHLTEHGVMEPTLLFESPFTDITPKGPDDLFSGTQIAELVKALEWVKVTALAA